MRTIDTISIPTRQDTAFRLLALAEQWPTTTTSVKRVQVSREDPYSRLLSVFAMNGILPFGYSAIQRQFPESFRVEHHVVTGIASDMTTIWQVNSVSEGSLVQIVNVFGPDSSPPSRKLWEWYVGRVWLRNHSLRVVREIQQHLSSNRIAVDPDDSAVATTEKIVAVRRRPALIRPPAKQGAVKKVTSISKE